MPVKNDLQEPWKTKVPVTATVGTDIQVRQIHLALFPEPTLHVGVATGAVGATGAFESAVLKTVVIPLDKIGALNPGQQSSREATIMALVDMVYALLREGVDIPDGKRG